MESKLTFEEFQKEPELVFDFLDFFFKFKAYNYQKKFLISCLMKNRVAGKWPRQSGKSKTVAAYATFRSIMVPTSIMIIAPTQTQSSELYSKIREFVNYNDTITSDMIKSTETELKFKNGS